MLFDLNNGMNPLFKTIVTFSSLVDGDKSVDSWFSDGVWELAERLGVAVFWEGGGGISPTTPNIAICPPLQNQGSFKVKIPGF
jgi:hypothetical protein